MKKIIVTGGCGFIGSHLCEILSQDNEVHVLDNLSTGRISNLDLCVSDNIRFHNVDISDTGQLADYLFDSCDEIYHLAALADIVPSITMPDSYMQSNVVGTYNLLQAARRSSVKKLVYVASSSCYGIPQSYPTDESSPIDVKYPYALTKRLGEELSLHWSHVYKLDVKSVRLFNVYGPRARTAGTYGAVFGVFLAQLLNNKPLTIVGDGHQTRDFTYVTDVCEAMVAVMSQGKSGEIYNVGSGATVSINYIAELLGGTREYIPKRPGEPDCTFANIQKIIRETGWAPKVSIIDGVKKMLEQIEYWKDAPVWNKESINMATKEWFEYLNG